MNRIVTSRFLLTKQLLSIQLLTFIIDVPWGTKELLRITRGELGSTRHQSEVLRQNSWKRLRLKPDNLVDRLSQPAVQ
ncbi:MAG: hypothetical protein O2968_11410 [Acidobacteria bacterium]|nr:hypothetical protein [Acidobacteriota bacterium]